MHRDEHRQPQQYRQYRYATIHEQPPEIRDASSDDARVYCATSARASGNVGATPAAKPPPAIRAHLSAKIRTLFFAGGHDFARRENLAVTLPLPLTFLLARPAEAQQSKLSDKIDSNMQDWLGTHKQLHPELPLRKRKPPRSTNGIAQAAGVPDERKPLIEITKDNVPATVNDAALTKRVATAMEKSLGKENVVSGKPIMASEDFCLFDDEDVLVGSQRSREV
jgi:hypothetical protein